MTPENNERTLGKLPPDAFGCLDLPEIAPGTLAGFRSLPDLAGMVSDAMDLLGIEGAISASVLAPTIPGSRVVGPALTVRNRRRNDTAAAAVAAHDNRLADIEAHNLAKPGDVLVVQGAEGVSSLGGIAAAIASRQDEAAIIVDGYVRDLEASRGLGLPIWARGVTPATGKWRLETLGINQPVEICGIIVNAGDLIVADDTGICVVPRLSIDAVLTEATRIAENEALRLHSISSGTAIRDLPAGRYAAPIIPNRGNSEVP